MIRPNNSLAITFPTPFTTNVYSVLGTSSDVNTDTAVQLVTYLDYTKTQTGLTVVLNYPDVFGYITIVVAGF